MIKILSRQHNEIEILLHELSEYLGKTLHKSYVEALCARIEWVVELNSVPEKKAFWGTDAHGAAEDTSLAQQFRAGVTFHQIVRPNGAIVFFFTNNDEDHEIEAGG